MRSSTIGLVVVALLAVRAHGAVAFYTSPGAFDAARPAAKVSKFVETFEESTVSQGSKQPFPNPLMHGLPRDGFPNGIDALNLIIQTNITPGPLPAALNPSNNPRALWVNGQNFIGSNSIKVGTDEFLYQLDSSLDLIFTSGDKTAVSLSVSNFAGFNAGHAGYVFGVYDTANNLMGSFAINGPAAPEPSKNFMGILASAPIGRVNVYGIFSQPQPFAIDNIEMWVPAPGTGAMLGVAALLAAKRRRR